MKQRLLPLCRLLIYFGTASAVYGAAPLTLRIQPTNQPPNSVRFDWNSQSGTSYQILSATNIDPFSFWMPASGTIAATGTNTAAVGPATNEMAFYKLHTLGQSGTGKPTVSIVSHTNGETLSGLTRIAVAAQDDSRLSFVTLLVDGAPYEAAITEGDLYWSVNTGHFSNGVHTVQALAVDNAGNAALGGNPDNALGGNSVLSAPVTLNFSNIVRWLEPPNGFDTVVPISIRSSVFPTNWTVYVENEAGAIIRTFTGFTADGVVETEWNGNDNIGVPAPVEHGYRVLFVLGELPPPGPAPEPGPDPGPAPGPGAAAMQPSQSAPQLVSYDQYGSPIYEVTTPLPPIPAIYFDENVQEEIKQGKRPPLPPLIEGTFSEDAKNPKFKKRRMSFLEASSFSASQSSSSQNLAGAGLDANPATNDVIVWREAPWQSGQTILARQKFGGAGLVLNSVFANNLATLATDIATAELNDNRLNGRTVYGSAPSVVDVSNDFDVLLNDLKSPGNANVRDFYYIGHSSGYAIGYSEGSKTNGIDTAKLRLALGNFLTRNAPRWQGRWLLTFKYPYRFVFIDGCLSATGSFYQSFGIIPDNVRTRLGKNRRAFLGWEVETKNSIINQNQANWSGRFWKAWIDNDNEDYDVALGQAVINASALVTIPQQPRIIGDVTLRWSD